MLQLGSYLGLIFQFFISLNYSKPSKWTGNGSSFFPNNSKLGWKKWWRQDGEAVKHRISTLQTNSLRFSCSLLVTTNPSSVCVYLVCYCQTSLWHMTIMLRHILAMKTCNYINVQPLFTCTPGHTHFPNSSSPLLYQLHVTALLKWRNASVNASELSCAGLNTVTKNVQFYHQAVNVWLFLETASSSP